MCKPPPKSKDYFLFERINKLGTKTSLVDSDGYLESNKFSR